MRRLIVIGIGAGHPDYVTIQAVKAMNEVDVFFVVDKGEAKDSLIELREQILAEHVTRPHRVVKVRDPERDRGARAYAGAVRDWHAARATLFSELVAAELPADGVGGFLVWGDPALYDSTLRVVEAMDTVPFTYDVVPGITSVQALAAQHKILLNRIGGPVHITTGRRLATGFPPDLDDVVVMLDAGLACQDFTEDLDIYWGAYLGTPDEVLISGRLTDVAAEIVRRRTELRSRHGWIMDTYLLRRR